MHIYEPLFKKLIDSLQSHYLHNTVDKIQHKTLLLQSRIKLDSNKTRKITLKLEWCRINHGIFNNEENKDQFLLDEKIFTFAMHMRCRNAYDNASKRKMKKLSENGTRIL